MGVKDFAVHCTALDRCAAVYAGGLHVVVWRAVGRHQLAAMVEVPQTFYNRTVGLMGLWSSTRADDFLMSDGRMVLSSDLNPPSEERLHNFGLSCELSNRRYCSFDNLASIIRPNSAALMAATHQRPRL